MLLCNLFIIVFMIGLKVFKEDVKEEYLVFWEEIRLWNNLLLMFVRDLLIR